ncbi:hypothetical protein TNCV_1468831 [Trichonephila clavipes]|nr:hypothetical protein TNCV_1468831 [Trichonephila clavipes]
MIECRWRVHNFYRRKPNFIANFQAKSVSLSTMEAEYVSLTEAAKEFIWLKNVIDNKSLNLELSENVMFCDNQEAAISFQSHRWKIVEQNISMFVIIF